MGVDGTGKPCYNKEKSAVAGGKREADEVTEEKRTLVEFYDREHMENVISLLNGTYTHVVYVYFLNANEPDCNGRETLTRFIRERFGLTPGFLEIPRHCMECAVESFRTLTSLGGRYDFDVTGGSPVFVAAAGMVLAEDTLGRITLHEYDTARGTCVFRAPSDAPPPLPAASRELTVSQVLAMRGIPVLEKEKPVRYDLERDDLRGVILRLWKALRHHLRAWNSFCILPTESEAKDGYVQMKKRVNVNTEKSCQELLDVLMLEGLVSHRDRYVKENETWISFRLNIPGSAAFLCSKGGNLLEMMTYLTAVDSGLTADCCTGIKLDWDGCSQSWGSNPFNEIDVVMTVGHIPYFISCKSTAGENEYLYEIMTMTRHFGGRYAVAMLVSASATNQAFRTRAKEMGVVLIDGVKKMTAEEFSRCLKDALK